MDELKTLYAAAGGGAEFKYPRLVQLAEQNGFKVKASNLSDWLLNNPPRAPRHVTYVMKVLIPFLEERAAHRSQDHAKTLEGPWASRLLAAQAVSRSGQGGRGPRVHAASPGRLLGGPSPAMWDVLPRAFVGREEELAYLEAFVTDPDSASSYLWWQAGSWAGKTALMAWFAARRLPAGVDVAHYIIAGRLGTDRRDGFIRAVGAQLAVAAGNRRRPAVDRKLPTLDPLYEAAARGCAERHRRLVLIVDGLDEDADAGLHSPGIAGLLPKSPPHGMRVIVTGRPYPRVPVKLAPDHPLRDPAIVRRLSASPAARVIRDTALTELGALLADRDSGHRLLGLLVAARGALTGEDLGDLTGITPFELQEKLHSVVGRSMAPTRTDLLPLAVQTEEEAEASRQTFVLAHDELHKTAREALGRRSLAARTHELHDWARQYQDEGWPEDTPNYLLTGYTHLLHENRDTERLTALVLDPQRQLRLTRRSGPDVALRHLDLLAPPDAAPSPPPAPGTGTAVGVSREMIRAHVRPLPDPVSRTIARLGDARRARALAAASGRAVDKARHLAGVARVLQAMGDEHAADTAQEAGKWARVALREAGRLGCTTDEAEAAAGQAALALLETARMPGHPHAKDARPDDPPVLGMDARPPSAATSHTAKVRSAQVQHEDGLTLLRSLHGTGSSRTEAWALAARLLAPDHPDQATQLLDELEEQADELAAGDPAEADASVGAIHLWHTVACMAPDRADRLHDRMSEHAQEVWDAAPTLENISVAATAASLVAQSRPAEAKRMVDVACQHIEQVLSPDGSPLPPADAFHVEFGFRHTLALLSQALNDVGASAETAARVRELAQQALPAEPEDPPEQVGSDNDEDQAFAEATSVADEAFRLADHGADEEAERHLEQALALLPMTSPGTGHSPVWLPDLASALIHTDAAADAEALLDLALNAADQVRAHTAMALAYADSGQQPAARRHAQEASKTATRNGSWPYAALALACAGEVESALHLIEQHEQPNSAGSRSAWRKTDRTARIAVATELATLAPRVSGELILPLLQRLHAARKAIRSQGLLTSLAELLPAATHLAPAQQLLLDETLEDALAHATRSSPQSWHPEEVLVQAFLRIDAGKDPTPQLDWLTNDMANRGTEHFPTTALAVLHTAMSDAHTAERIAALPHTPQHRATALTAVASHLARVPVRPHPSPEPSRTNPFLRAIQHLALKATSTTPPDNEAASRPLQQVLTTSGWHHAIPVLARLAPEALTAVHHITMTHLTPRANPLNSPQAQPPETSSTKPRSRENPARTGNSRKDRPSSSATERSTRALLHEQRTPTSCAPRVMEPSPHVRGAGQAGPRPDVHRGTIPARAGNRPRRGCGTGARGTIPARAGSSQPG
ncbi:hypothetical protein [Streptomyces achmelvichensis]|uniref:hypothetical protein n=1 Tax=Streptomyces achmelvichensis TaxID=3134111 RepID=UPI003C12BF67